MYADVAHFAETWGLGFLGVLFLGVLIYALWPGNQKKFDRAARAPLDQENNDGE